MLKSSAIRVGVLAFTSLCLVFLFAVRPMRLIAPLTTYGQSPASLPLTPTMQELIKAEMQKANDEIKLWIQFQNDWFHYKFLLVGAVVAILVGFVKLTKEKEPQKDIAEILMGDISCLIFATACVIALAIDMSLRNNIVVVQQLALWIAHYSEPALLQIPSSNHPGSFLPWEQFLRVQASGMTGMHSDDWYGFAFYPYLHFLTWVIYTTYLWILFEAWHTHPQRRGLLISSFAMVQTTLAIFTWLAHAAPTAFEFKLFPWGDEWVSGPHCATIYLWFWVAITVLNCLPLMSHRGRRNKVSA